MMIGRKRLKSGTNHDETKKVKCLEKAAALDSVSLKTARPALVNLNPPTAVSERGFGLSQSCRLSRRQESILSKRRAAEEQQLARQQELEEEVQAETDKKLRKDQPAMIFWSEVEKDIFFQGVLNYGRDFEQLHKYFLTKTKINGLPEKNKSQIRHFYYRTVKNIQSIVNMQNVSKNKEANEVFAVVNWMEFRRKIGGKLSLLSKHSEKLKQLIYTGETKFKYKGKLIKIRTPSCPLLNKLYEKAREESSTNVLASQSNDKKKINLMNKPAKVPDYLYLELQPKTNAAWHRVSEISHNPHLRLKVKSDQTLSSVIEAIEKKWVPSSARFRKELNLEWDKLPYIKLYPPSNQKLQAFDLSQLSNNPPAQISFNGYLKLTKEVGYVEKADSEDPVKFLKEKLNNITSQISNKLSDDGDTSTEADHTKSYEWISTASHGWSVTNTKDLSIACLYFLYGAASEKIALHYEWPDLERADEIVHIFAGMISRLISTADCELSSQGTKKKQISLNNSPTTSAKSPSLRGGRKASPNAPKQNTLISIKPAPSKDSPEFKKPGVPLQSENRQLADAIALGRQDLKPLARKSAARPMLIQRTLLPSHSSTASSNTSIIIPKSVSLAVQPNVKTMDVSCIRSNTAGMIVASKIQPVSSDSEVVDISSTPLIQSMLASQAPSVASSTNSVVTTLTNIISSVNNTQCNIPGLKAPTFEEMNDNSNDILSQALASIKTPVKRRITPTLVSSNIEDETMFNLCNNSSNKINNSDFDQEKMLSDSLSENSLSSLLSSLQAVANTDHTQVNNPVIDQRTLTLTSSNHLDMCTTGAAVGSFKGIIHEESTMIGSQAEDSIPLGHRSNAKDTWLTADITMSDFSLSSLLGDKSPRRSGSEIPSSLHDVNLTDRPMSSMGEDSRMSFLSKLDVNDLELDHPLSHMILGESSLDFMPKYESLSGTLETPKK